MVTFLFCSVIGAFSPANIMYFSFCRNKKSLFEGKKDRKHNEDEGNEVVPSEGLGLEHGDHDDGEHGERDGFLDDFQLDEIERAAVDGRADAVGWNHKRIFEQGDAPRHKDD